MANHKLVVDHLDEVVNHFDKIEAWCLGRHEKRRSLQRKDIRVERKKDGTNKLK